MPQTDTPRIQRAVLATAVLVLVSILLPANSRATTSFAVIGAPESFRVRVQLGATVNALRLPVVRWNGSHGVLVLRLDPARYNWQFVAVGGSTFRDAGSTPCL